MTRCLEVEDPQAEELPRSDSFGRDQEVQMRKSLIM